MNNELIAQTAQKAGTLLSCPRCFQLPHYRSFGSITATGELVVMRKANFFTIIVAKEYTVLCDCGYSITYSGGKISTAEYRSGYQHEQD